MVKYPSISVATADVQLAEVQFNVNQTFFQKEESNCSKSVEALAVSYLLVIPAERYQNTTELVNLWYA